MVRTKRHLGSGRVKSDKSAQVIGAPRNPPTHLSTASNRALYLMSPLIPLDPPPPDPVLPLLIEVKPRGSGGFVTNVTNQISIDYSRWRDFLIKHSDLEPLASPDPLSNMFSMWRGSSRVHGSGRNTIHRLWREQEV